jgi:PAS domain S-box-containing protein
MASKDDRPADAAELRRRAEVMAGEKAAQSPENLEALSPEEVRRTLHELRVHQIELEMQNEELRRAQVELDAARARYFDLYDMAPVGYCTISEQGLILEANLTAAGLLGVARGALVRQPITRFIFQEDQDIYYRRRKQLFETGEPQASDLRMVRTDGSAFWVLLEATLVQDAGGVPVCRAVISDITERKRAGEEREKLQAQLAQAQKMETIGRLAGGVAHDFNNLLTVINGYSVLALRRLPPADPLFHDLTEVLHAGERAAGLVRQLLAFSRKQVLHPEVLGLNATVGDMEKMLRRLVGEDIEIVVRLDPAVAPALVDRRQIEQVILNLAVNARDAMPGGGTLTLETGQRRLEGVCATCHQQIRPGTYLELTVRDTGMGMDQQTLENVFEPFFTTKGAGRGTGLGLSTVQGIVIQSGGHIVVESEPGQGSAFHVYLPVAERPAPAPGPLPPAEADGGAETILLVEDHEEVRRFIAAILSGYGYRVVDTGDAEQALNLCAAQPVDLLITDVVMPKMSGVELARRARLCRAGLRTLFISGYSAVTHERKWESLQEASFLQKPFSPEALAKKVREALEGR